MFQVLDIVDTTESINGEHRVQCIYLVVKNETDLKVSTIKITDFHPHVYVAIDHTYTQDHVDAMVSGCNKHMAQANWMWKQNDAILNGDIFMSNAFLGFELKPRPFARLTIRSTKAANNDMLDFLVEDTKDVLIPENQRGCYNFEYKPSSAFSTSTRMHSMCWVNAAGEYQVVPPTKPDLPMKIITLDIETPTDSEIFPEPLGVKHGPKDPEYDPNKPSYKQHPVPVGCIAYKTKWDGQRYFLCVRGNTTIDVAPDPRPGANQIRYLYNTERDMLIDFHKQMMAHDPDFFETYNGNQFDFPFLFNRMDYLGIPLWRKWSRVPLLPTTMRESKGGNDSKGSFGRVDIKCAGRVFQDAMSYIQDEDDMETVSKSLNDVCEELGLGKKKDMPIRELYPRFHGTAKDRQMVEEYNLEDVELTEKVVDAKQMVANVCEFAKCLKITLNNQAKLGISSRLNRFIIAATYPHFLMRSCRYNYTTRQSELPLIITQNPQEMKFRETSYEGGLVMDPKYVGLIAELLLSFDYNSLYPSLMRAYNYCLSTLLHSREYADSLGFVEGVHYDVALNGALFVKKSIREGLLPKLCAKLIDDRNEVKKAIKKESDPLRKQALDVKQKALKITNNSIYGNMGLKVSLIGYISVADAVTSKGRYHVAEAKKQVETDPDLADIEPEVVYMDTDSNFIMVKNVDPNNLELLKSVQDRIYKSLNITSGLLAAHPVMNIAAEHVIPKSFFKGKKNYAYSHLDYDKQGNPTYPITFKGMSIVRGDRVPYNRRIGKELFGLVMDPTVTPSPVELVQFVEQKYADLLAGAVESDELQMSMKLSKAVADYDADKKGASVIAARQLVNKGQCVRSGDVMKYFYCKTEHCDGSVSSRIVPKDLLDAKAPIDLEFYGDKFASDMSVFLHSMIGEAQTSAIFSKKRYNRKQAFIETALSRSLNMAGRDTVAHSSAPLLSSTLRDPVCSTSSTTSSGLSLARLASTVKTEKAIGKKRGKRDVMDTSGYNLMDRFVVKTPKIETQDSAGPAQV